MKYLDSRLDIPEKFSKLDDVNKESFVIKPVRKFIEKKLRFLTDSCFNIGAMSNLDLFLEKLGNETNNKNK